MTKLVYALENANDEYKVSYYDQVGTGFTPGEYQTISSRDWYELKRKLESHRNHTHHSGPYSLHFYDIDSQRPTKRVVAIGRVENGITVFDQIEDWDGMLDERQQDHDQYYFEQMTGRI